MFEWAGSIILEIAKWVVAFVLGLLVRKSVGRAFVKAKKWLLNEVVPTQIISIRTYVPQETPVEIREFTREVYEDVRIRILNLQLHDTFRDGMRVEIPHFGILRLILSRIIDQKVEEHQEETLERIKLTLQPESPVRLGIREIHLLNDYSQTVEKLLNSAERLITTRKQINQDYTILEFPRTGRFVEEKTFETDDEDLGTHIHATAKKLTLTVSPTSQITKATKKYLLV